MKKLRFKQTGNDKDFPNKLVAKLDLILGLKSAILLIS